MPVLGPADLRRAVLARQLLAGRAELALPAALERVAGLQSQYAPSMYIGCWSRVADFQRADLTSCLQTRQVVQGTMMRSTIHLVSAADYWPLNRAIRQARREWTRRVHRDIAEGELEAAADRVRRAFDSTEHINRMQLEAAAGKRLAGDVGLFVDLVRVPPSGTWERRRADLYALAESWVGPEPDLSDADAVDHLVRRYLTGFGSATANEIASWAGMTIGTIRPALERLELERAETEDGAVLVDLPGLPLPPPDAPCPVRFLGTWEALLLVHARRASILREEDRPRIFSSKTPHSFNTFLVDGIVGGTWRFEVDHIETSPWRPLTRSERRQLDAEAERLGQLYQ